MHDASKAAFVALTLTVALQAAGSSRHALAQTAPSPDDALKSIRVTEGLELQLFAAEPMVEQPVSMSFDDRGRLWVLQYRQYPIPNGLKPTAVDEYLRTKYDRVPEPPPHGPKGNDRIAILEDVDGDGRADRSKTFLEGLNLASGFALGYDGVFVRSPLTCCSIPTVITTTFPTAIPKCCSKALAWKTPTRLPIRSPGDRTAGSTAPKAAR